MTISATEFINSRLYLRSLLSFHISNMVYDPYFNVSS